MQYAVVGVTAEASQKESDQKEEVVHEDCTIL